MPWPEAAPMTTGSIFLPEPIQAYLAEIGLREPAALAALRRRTAALPQAHYQIAPEEGELIRFLVELTGARAGLDIGTFTGYSALAAALAMPEGGRVVSFDVSEDFTAIAREAWAAAGVAGRIDLRLGPAIDGLTALIEAGAAGTYDLAVIDADKEGYAAYYEACLTLLRPGGVILLDNTLWRGRVADPDDRRPRTEAVRALNAMIHGDRRVTPIVLPIGDGVTLALKRP
jgi:caffeoyl-CoA O-methyltransferase